MITEVQEIGMAVDKRKPNKKLSSNNSNTKRWFSGLQQTGAVCRCRRRTAVYNEISSTYEESGTAEVPNDLENPAPLYI